MRKDSLFELLQLGLIYLQFHIIIYIFVCVLSSCVFISMPENFGMHLNFRLPSAGFVVLDLVDLGRR